jgi:hypothetical protein
MKNGFLLWLRPMTKGLKEIGFINVDVFLKHHLWCAIGGQKTL